MQKWISKSKNRTKKTQEYRKKSDKNNEKMLLKFCLKLEK